MLLASSFAAGSMIGSALAAKAIESSKESVFTDSCPYLEDFGFGSKECIKGSGDSFIFRRSGLEVGGERESPAKPSRAESSRGSPVPLSDWATRGEAGEEGGLDAYDVFPLVESDNAAKLSAMSVGCCCGC